MNNNNITFQISDLEKQSEDKYIGDITVFDKNKNNIGKLSYKKYTHKIFIDHVFVNEECRGKGICPKMFSILIDKFPEIQMFMLSNYGGIPSCKCYIKSFIDKKFDIYIGGGLFNYEYMKNSNMKVKPSKVHIKHNNNNFKNNNNIRKKTKKNKIEKLCNDYSDYADIDFLFVRR